MIYEQVVFRFTLIEEYDPHADDVLSLLYQMGHEPARIHTADVPQYTSLSLSYDRANWKNLLQTRTRTIPLDEVRSIWWRRPAEVQLPETLTPYEHAKRYGILVVIQAVGDTEEKTKHDSLGQWSGLFE
jgi:hypothetical protein